MEEKLAKIRRRVEDHLRKNPILALVVAKMLGIPTDGLDLEIKKN